MRKEGNMAKSREIFVPNTVEEALEALRNGEMIIVVDDPDRENEGDIIMAAEKVNAAAMNFILKEARGLVCAAVDEERAQRLNLLPMVDGSVNTSSHHTNFTVSVDARHNTSTGISAQDRTETFRVIADPASQAEDLLRPGHIFPILAREGGVLRRTGHTEASVDLCRLAGLQPAALLCEILSEDGHMARMPQLEAFARKHSLKLITIADLLAHRRHSEKLTRLISTVNFPNEYGDFLLHLFEDTLTAEHHLALTMGDLSGEDPVLVRVHSECLTGDVFSSARCDCGEQKDYALREIARRGRGVLIYLRQEGRGIGLKHKILAYELQEKGRDTVEANEELGFKADLREYGIGAQMLKALGVRRMQLMTNNPKKMVGLAGYDLEIVDRLPIELPPKEHNYNYMKTKREKMGHLLEMKGLKHEDL